MNTNTPTQFDKPWIAQFAVQFSEQAIQLGIKPSVLMLMVVDVQLYRSEHERLFKERILRVSEVRELQAAQRCITDTFRNYGVAVLDLDKTWPTVQKGQYSQPLVGESFK